MQWVFIHTLERASKGILMQHVVPYPKVTFGKSPVTPVFTNLHVVKRESIVHELVSVSEYKDINITNSTWYQLKLNAENNFKIFLSFIILSRLQVSAT
jgi:hypothetical protein